jgi:hypothetical protein
VPHPSRPVPPSAINNTDPAHVALPKWLWPVFPAFATFTVFMIGVLVPSAWSWLDVDHLRPYFADLVAVLAASDAHGAGLDPYAVPAPLDPYGRPHVYGPWWLQLHHLGLSTASAPWLGLLTVIIAITALTWMLGVRNHKQALMAAALMASPPLLLSYERANNDLIILLILIAAGMIGRRVYGYVLQAGLLSLAAALKFYPIVALPLLAYRQTRCRGISGMAITAAITLLFLYIWRHDIHQATTLMPRPDTIYGFGMSLIPHYLTALPDSSMQLAAAAGIVAGASLVAFTTGRSKHHYLSMTQGRTGGWFIAGGLCWVGCYLLNTNYVYRSLLLMLTAASWFRLWQTEAPAEGKHFRNLLLVTVIMLWIHNACAHAIKLESPPSIYAAIFGMGAMQGIALAVTVVITVALLMRGLNILAEWHAEPQTRP